MGKKRKSERKNRDKKIRCADKGPIVRELGRGIFRALFMRRSLSRTKRQKGTLALGLSTATLGYADGVNFQSNKYYGGEITKFPKQPNTDYPEQSVKLTVRRGHIHHICHSFMSMYILSGRRTGTEGQNRQNFPLSS